jgi:beta-glucosidase
MVAHQLNLAHGEGMRIIRRNCPSATAGITLNLTPGTAKSDSVADQEALRLYDGVTNRWFLDPVLKGKYPEDMLEPLASNLEEFDIDEVKAAAEPMDFLGVNYYSRSIVQWDDSQPLRFGTVRSQDAEFTAMDWEIYPQGITDLLVRLDKEYQPPAIYITENGAAFDDPEPENGAVHDPKRVEYLREHFNAVNAAIEQGVPVKGYFVWSFMDNFEWAEGYDKRFGIVRVNYDTQERTPKDSANFLKQVIQTGEVG